MVIFCDILFLHWWQVSIDSGNGQVPSGNRSVPESMLNQTSDAYHQVSFSLTWINLNSNMDK